MKRIRLYRGISINENDVEDVMEDIKNNGIYFKKEMLWKGFEWDDLRQDYNYLVSKKDLSLHETRSDKKPRKGVCFADKIGAHYYACDKNMTKDKTVPIVITADVDVHNVAIDGRDFLYTVFAFFERQETEKTNRQRVWLSKLFGDRINLYLDKLIEHPYSDPCAVCDLAICDSDIIIAHSKNEIQINGRHKTKFKSAFFVEAPIKPEDIENVEANVSYIEPAGKSIDLNEILER